MKNVLLSEKHLRTLLSVIWGEKWAGKVPQILERNSALTFLTAALPKQ